jgi:hypothetical protein
VNKLKKIFNQKYKSHVAEHPESFQHKGKNAVLQEKNSTYRCKTNTYAKTDSVLQITLDIQWIIHNFVQLHFTPEKVPAVATWYYG